MKKFKIDHNHDRFTMNTVDSGMQSILISMFFLLIPCFILGQDLDTIVSPWGGYTIIHSEDQKRMDEEIEEFGHTLFRGNYWIYDDNGVLEKQGILLEKDSVSYEEKRTSSLMTSSREAVLYGDFPVYTTRTFYESGKLEYEQISCKEFIEERTYYDNERNSLSVYQRQALQKPAEFRMIEIESKIDSSIIVEQMVETPVLVWQSYFEYHENGRLKTIGKFSRRKFLTFTSDALYRAYIESDISIRGIENLYIDGEKLIAHYHPAVKDGKWIYLDENGELKEELTYSEGKLLIDN